MKTFIALVCIQIAALTPAGAQGVIREINFDDVSTDPSVPGSTDTSVPILDGYGGLRWEGFFIQNSDATWDSRVTSPPNFAHNNFEATAAISGYGPFTLVSASLSPILEPSAVIRVQGFSRGSLVFDNRFDINLNEPTVAAFEDNLVDRVLFTSEHVLGGPGFGFSIDDLVIAVPEPPSSLLVLGAGAVCCVVRLLASGIESRSRR
jgi:hypothetical protein